MKPQQSIQIDNEGPLPSLPEHQETLAGLHCEPVGEGTRLRFEPSGSDRMLVLAAGLDKRNFCRLVLRAPDQSWEYLLDASYCSIGQRFHFVIPSGINEVSVHAEDPDPCLWVLADTRRLPGAAPSLWPIEPGANRLDRFFERLEWDGLAEFGWMGGCVLEAFHALARGGEETRWNEARDRWLSFFLDDQHLHYQTATSHPFTDRFNTIEAILPLASIVRMNPGHPIIDQAIAFVREQHGSQHLTCEGCYTVAYPLAQMAETLDRPELLDLALQELLFRREALCHEGHIYLRFLSSSHRTYRDWARGVGWYLLGHAECLRFAGVGGKWKPVAEHLAERCAWVLRHQRDDGLWNNFFQEGHLPPDTAGSAGIAAALIQAHHLGLVGPEGIEAAKRCWDALQDHLLIDGWLGNSSPSNKRGEGIQHTSLRAAETFGLGLMGLLVGMLKTS